MNNTLQDQIKYYSQYIGKEVLCVNKKLPVLIVKAVIKHPFKQQAAYKFENIKEIILCENCVESLDNEKENHLQKLNQYIDHTIFFKDNSQGINLPDYIHSNNNIENFYKVKSVFFDNDTSTYYFVLHNNEIKEAKNFHLFKHSECFYTDFKHYKNIHVSKWIEMFNIFHNVDESLLCFDTSGVEQEYKVKGFALTNYSDGKKNEWHLLNILYDTSINSYTYTLNKMAKTLAQYRDMNYKIENRSLYFFLNGKVFEFFDREDKASLKAVSNEIKWVLKNHTLHEKLKEKLPQKTEKIKKNKI